MMSFDFNLFQTLLSAQSQLEVIVIVRVYCHAAQSASERLCMQSCKIAKLVGGQTCLRVSYLSCALSCSIKFSRLL